MKQTIVSLVASMTELIKTTVAEYAESHQCSISTARRFLNANHVKTTVKKVYVRTPYNDTGKKRISVTVFHISENETKQ